MSFWAGLGGFLRLHAFSKFDSFKRPDRTHNQQTSSTSEAGSLIRANTSSSPAKQFRNQPLKAATADTPIPGTATFTSTERRNLTLPCAGHDPQLQHLQRAQSLAPVGETLLHHISMSANAAPHRPGMISTLSEHTHTHQLRGKGPATPISANGQQRRKVRRRTSSFRSHVCTLLHTNQTLLHPRTLFQKLPPTVQKRPAEEGVRGLSPGGCENQRDEHRSPADYRPSLRIRE